MQEFGQISILCWNLAGQIMFATNLQHVFYLRESRKNFFLDFLEIFNFRKDRAMCLLFARTIKTSVFGKNVARYLTFISAIVCKKFSLFCKSLERSPIFARTLQNIFFCKNLSRSLLFGRFLHFATILQDISYLQEFFQISIVCKNLASFLFSARVLKEVQYLQESCKIFFLQKSVKITVMWKVLTR